MSSLFHCGESFENNQGAGGGRSLSPTLLVEIPRLFVGLSSLPRTVVFSDSGNWITFSAQRYGPYKQLNDTARWMGCVCGGEVY